MECLLCRNLEINQIFPILNANFCRSNVFRSSITNRKEDSPKNPDRTINKANYSNFFLLTTGIFQNLVKKGGFYYCEIKNETLNCLSYQKIYISATATHWLKKSKINTIYEFSNF